MISTFEAIGSYRFSRTGAEDIDRGVFEHNATKYFCVNDKDVSLKPRAFAETDFADRMSGDTKRHVTQSYKNSTFANDSKTGWSDLSTRVHSRVKT